MAEVPREIQVIVESKNRQSLTRFPPHVVHAKPPRPVRSGWARNGTLWHFVEGRRSLCERYRPLDDDTPLRQFPIKDGARCCPTCDALAQARMQAANPSPTPRSTHAEDDS